MKEILALTIKLLKESSLSSYKIAQDTGISDQTIINYRNGATLPRGNSLKILSKYLGIDEDTKKPAPTVVDDGKFITMPREIWRVIEDQAASLRAKDESLKIKDQQVSGVIALLKEQIKKGEDAAGQGHAAPQAAQG